MNQEATPTKFYGNYRGLVLASDDPYMAGRIKVQVFPMFTEITDPSLLPWAVPAMPISAGAGPGFGTFNVPLVGSYVWVFFEAGDPYQPVYFAEAQTATIGVPQLAGLNYPYRRVTTYPSGITTIVDDAAAAVFVIHPTGTMMEILGDGQINVQGVKGIVVTVNDDAQVLAGKNVAIVAGENALVQATQDIIVNGVNVTVNASKDATVNAGKTAQVNCKDAEVYASVDAYIEGGAYVIIRGGIVSINPGSVG